MQVRLFDITGQTLAVAEVCQIKDANGEKRLACVRDLVRRSRNQQLFFEELKPAAKKPAAPPQKDPPDDEQPPDGSTAPVGGAGKGGAGKGGAGR